MKKTALALTLIISAIFSLLAIEFQAAILVKGNIVPLSYVHITFPENDKTYYSSTLIMRYSAHFTSVMHKLVYNLDGTGNVTICDEYNDLVDINGSVTLSGLSPGSHHIIVYSESGTWFAGGDEIYFNIFVSPSEYGISLQSPQNGTYYSEPVLLNFTRFGHLPTLYNYLYAIDGQSIQSGTRVENIQHIGNEPITNDNFAYIEYTTWGWAYLPNLPEGAHNLTFCSLRIGAVYGDFQTVYFNINSESGPTPSPIPTATPNPTSAPEPTPKAAPFPTTLVVASVVLAAVIGIGLVVYFKKRQKGICW